MPRGRPRKQLPAPLVPPTTTRDTNSGPAIYQALLTVDAGLVAKGIPPISPYWRQELSKFYGHSSALTLVECVGRGGDKSRTSVKTAIAEVLAGNFAVPPGERHYFTHIAENKDEAAKTLGILERYLQALSIPHERRGDTIDLTNLPRGVKVLACRVGAVSGWRCIGWTADECSKWDNDGANPSAEVISSMRAMSVTHPFARGRIISSPMGRTGYFYEQCELGDTAEQLYGHAATWEANPSVTEAHTRKLEKYEPRWRREYAAIPMEDSDASVFTSAMLDRATRPGPEDLPYDPQCQYIAAQDPAIAEGGDAWTFVIATCRWVDGVAKRSIAVAREWPGPNERVPDAVFGEIAQLCRQYHVRAFYSDEHAAYALKTIASRHQLSLTFEPTTNQLKRYEDLAARLAEGEIDLPPNPVVRQDLLSVVRRLRANGISIVLQRINGRHADFAPSVALALSKGLAPPPKPIPPMSFEEKMLAYQMGMEKAFEKQLRDGDASIKRGGESWLEQMDREWRGEDE